MAELVWDQSGDRLYETGISKGVLYKEDGLGVAWNGLTSVDENSTKEVDAVHFDGVKFNDIVIIGDFIGTLRAFTYPKEFLYYEGLRQHEQGIYLTGQRPSRFGLSYQTLIGDDILGVESGYKIHVLYNLTAKPSSKQYKTLSLNSEPLEFEWEITSIPEEIENFRPTAHIVFDSREIDPSILSDIEDVLYGTSENNAQLPSFNSLSTIWKPIVEEEE